MTVIDETRHESRAFEADVAKLLNLIVHSVYSDKEVFVRELISNAADACEKLRYEAIASPDLLGDDPTLRITLLIDADNKRLTVEDNGIGMSREELVGSRGFSRANRHRTVRLEQRESGRPLRPPVPAR